MQAAETLHQLNFRGPGPQGQAHRRSGGRVAAAGTVGRDDAQPDGGPALGERGRSASRGSCARTTPATGSGRAGRDRPVPERTTRREEIAPGARSVHGSHRDARPESCTPYEARTEVRAFALMGGWLICIAYLDEFAQVGPYVARSDPPAHWTRWPENAVFRRYFEGRLADVQVRAAYAAEGTRCAAQRDADMGN